jgi:hypothetical protein
LKGGVLVKKSPKKEKPVFVDDGRTIANMDFELYTNYKRPDKKPVEFYRERQKEIFESNLTRSEKWAIIKSLYATLIPFVIIMFAGIALAMILITRYWEM